jgi:hypothetical protein
LLTPQADGGHELVYRNASPSQGSRAILLGSFEAARDEDFAQQVAQRNIATPLQGKIDAPLDKLILGFLERNVESVELAFLDGATKGEKELL